MAYLKDVWFYLYEKRNHKYFGLWTAAIGMVVGVLTNGVVFALSALLFLCLTLIIFLPWHRLGGKWQWKGATVVKLVISFVVSVVAGLIFWQPLVNVYPQLDVSSNLYVRPTHQPRQVVKGYEPKQKYQLLLEFGALRKEQYLSGVGVQIDVNGYFARIDKWWDDPKRTSMSDHAIYPFDKSFNVVDDPGMRQSWNITNVKENGEPPLYTLSFDDVPITSKRSFYIYFESDEPLRIRSLTFGGKVFHRQGKLLIPVE